MARFPRPEAGPGAGAPLRVLCGLVCALGVWIGSVPAGRCERGAESPLAAMREAAEAAAEIDPDAPTTARRTDVPRSGTAPASEAAVQAAVRAAVREEAARVAREGALNPGRGAANPGERRGQSEIGQAKGAAASAQQAEKNQTVQAQRGAKGRGPDGNGPPGQLKKELTGGGRRP